ncbi:hypothetical protein [Pseudomonas sp. P8_250]|uniref:hypothetical protein n=1 Tax=Pseudomonas sp. P8_250 TaxID=3043446 RepID=UPI002A35B944|nr:hypothetical protein [Pseudomonas sp. P8_250]MDX9668703.1 hypothetical protein [Pseudomonas sp. P8_250]
MEALLLTLFVVAVYGLIGYMSTNLFREWCSLLFDRNYEVAKAAGTVAATLWPIGWPAIILVGLFHAWLITYRELTNCLTGIKDSFKVVIEYYKESSTGSK